MDYYRCSVCNRYLYHSPDWHNGETCNGCLDDGQMMKVISQILKDLDDQVLVAKSVWGPALRWLWERQNAGLK